jgi:hypothetical protein
MVSGLARTVRGPSMSAFPGKVVVDGVVTLGGEKVFALQFLQARNPDWARRPFYAKFDPNATWLDDLVPAFGEKRFFFQEDQDDTHRDRQYQTIRLPAAREPRVQSGSPAFVQTEVQEAVTK